MRRSVVMVIFASLVAALAATAVSARIEPNSPLEGRWKLAGPKPTAQALIAKGMTPARADALLHNGVTTPAMEYHAGHFRWFDLATGTNVATGTYVVRGDEVTFTTTWQSSAISKTGLPPVVVLRWSIFRHRLTFSAPPGRYLVTAITISPWVRVD